MPELVSVILPVYKPQLEYLKRAIQSILGQTYANFELIIIEDPSEFTGQEIIKSFNDERIKYVLNQERTNFASQINQGLNLARGNFIARMDADDLSRPERLEKQLSFLLAHQEISAVGSNLIVIDEQDKIIGQRIYPDDSVSIAKKMCMKNVMAHSAVMFKKNDILTVGGYQSEFGTLADYDLWARMILAGYKFYNLQEFLLQYRLHQGATKKYFLKNQLSDTLHIKQKYFRWKKDWNSSAKIRYWLEKILLFMPNKFIYWLFVKTNIVKTQNSNIKSQIDNMRIAYVSPVFPPLSAGMGTACFYTADKIGQEHEATVFLANRRVNYQTGHYQIKLFKPWFSFGYADLVPQLFWQLKNFDIIHHYYPYFGVAEFLCFFKKIFYKKIPKIIFHYQMDMVGKGMSKFVNQLHKIFIAPWLFKIADAVFVLSEDYAKNCDIKKYYFKYPEKFYVVPNGVDIDKFKIQEEINLKATGKIIFTAQALDKAHFFKGIDVLIEAIKIIDRPDVKLVIAGDGDLKEYYQNLVNKFSVQENVSFLGQISHDQLPKYYNAATLVAVPSVKKTESFSVTAVEAMASCKPVIVSDLPGLRVTPKNNVSGLLVKPGSAKDLAEKILFFIDNPEQALVFGRAARKRAEELYDWDKICEKIEKIYQEIIV